jgi:tetratricopeptide (TPR) repeat protein
MALPAYERGDFIGDSLQVIEKLGEGGFGIVYLGRSLASNEIVAVKTLRGELLRDAKTRALFEKEARIWMDLGVHPNLVRARWITEIGGRLYIAMDYVRAGAGRPNSLEGHLERGVLPLDRSLLWAIQFCRGMEYAMSKGIRCHRDIKPANILIGEEQVVKISDFGIAGLALVPEAPAHPGEEKDVNEGAGPGDTGKTVVGTVFGTPTHMPPEQFVDAASCDERSDIYSFGVVMYQMASGGRLPFLPPPPPQALAAQAGAYYWHAFRILHSTAAEAPLSSALASIVARALRKKREERYPNFAALRADLESLYEKTKGEKAPVQAEAKATADSWNDRGISLAALDRWEEALACYDKAIALEADSAALHNNRGNALRNLGQGEAAAAAYDRAIELDPLYAAPWENRALLYANAQRNADALRCIERSLALDPTSGAAWVIKGVMLGRLQGRDDELAAYDEALRHDPRNVPAWLNKANVLGATNRVLALQCANQVLACDPANVSGWDLKGTLLAELGRPSEAIPCHLEARRLAPRDGRVAYNLGNAWCALGRLEEGRAAFEDATRLAPDMPITWYNLALATLRLGRPAQSVPLFEHFLSLDPPRDGLRATAERFTSELKAGRVPVIGNVTPGARISPAEQTSIDAGTLPELKEPPAPTPSAPVAPTALVQPDQAAPAAPLAPEVPLPSPRPNLDVLLHDAANLFRSDKAEAALKVAEIVLKFDPRLGNALNTRASCLFKLGRLDEACAAAAAAVEAEPADLNIWLNKAVIEKEAGRLKDACRSAIDLIDIAQAGGSTSPAVDEASKALRELQAKGVVPEARGYPGWLGLGFQSMVSGRQKEGLDFFDKAVAAAPKNVEVLRWKGSALKEMKRADEALAFFDRALALSPEDPEIHHDRGIVLSMLRDYKGAVEAFDRALAIDPDHVASLSDKGKYAGELGQHEVSLRALRRAVALTPNHPAPWLNKAMVEDLLKRDEDALASFERFLKLARPEMRLQIESSKRRVEQLRARVAARTGHPASPSPQAIAATPAVPAASKAPTDPPFLSSAAAPFPPGTVAPAAEASAEGLPTGLIAPSEARPTGNPVARKYAEQGRLLLAANKPAEAVAAFDKAVERDPSEALYWAARGGALLVLSRHDEASASWKKALGLNPACVPALMGLADAERRAGRPKDAIPYLMEAAGLDPNPAEAWFEIGDAYRQIPDWPNAYGAFSLSVKAAPRNALAIVGLAECALNVGKLEDALTALEVAIGLDNGIALAFYLRGVAFSIKGLNAEAVEAQRRAVELDPSRVNAWHGLARSLLELKRYAEALEAVDRALQIRPDFAFALNTRGLALQALKRLDEAIAAFDRALAADPRSVPALCNKGNALLSLHRPEDALECFSQARGIKPDHQPAFDGSRAALAAVKAGLATKNDEKLAPGGVLMLPDVSVPKTAAKYSQDECLKRSEMARNQALYDRALEFSDQAIAADPRKPMAWLGKAESLFGLRRYAEAAAHAKKSIDLNPKFAPAWVRLASSFDALNANDAALAAWDKAIELVGQNVLSWNGKGLCLARMGRIEEALACHDKSLAIDPRFSLGKFYKGLREADLGRREDAIKSLQQFLALAPPNLAALSNEARKRLQELKA